MTRTSQISARVGWCRRLVGGVFAALLAVSLCVPASPARATTRTTASQAMAAFVKAYWDPDAQYFYALSTHQRSGHGNSPDGGLYSDFWWEARLWEVVMDAWETTHEPRYKTMIGQVYDGFLRQFPTFGSDFNDDLNWWAMASTRAHRLTGEQRYLTTASSLYERIIADDDTALGGGVWWRHSVKDQKNVATNAPLAVTAVELYRLTGEDRYLTDAKRLFAFVDTKLRDGSHIFDHLNADGTLVKWDFTYNFGAYIFAATELHEETGEAAYMTKALGAADWVTTRLTNAGTFRNEGIGDGGGFKSLLIRALVNLVHEHGQKQYLHQLQNNATQAWNHRRPDGLMGNDWSAPATSGALEALAASSGLTAVLLVPPDGVRGVLGESGTYEAENANVVGVDTEANGTGWTGRGYLAGWNRDGQQVTFSTNVAKGGCYRLQFRYSAGNGDAYRMVMVNSRVVDSSLRVPATGGWSDWRTLSVKHKLNKGYNSIQMRLDAASDNHNYLNLDTLQLKRC